MIWKKMTTIGMGLIPTMLSYAPNFHTKTATVTSQLFPNRNAKFLQLSRALEEDERLKFSKKNFLQDETDVELLNDVEKLFFIPANLDKSKKLNDFINQDYWFDDFDTMNQELKTKKYVREMPNNKYFIKYANIDFQEILKTMMRDSTSNIVIEEVKQVIREFYNFMVKIIGVEMTSKLVINFDMRLLTFGKSMTKIFQKIGAIAIYFDTHWWNKTYYAIKEWLAVNKNGIAFVHEMAHAIDYFTCFPINVQAVINSLNIEKIINRQKANYQNINLPLKFNDLIKIEKTLNNAQDFAVNNASISISSKFVNYIFKRVIETLNNTEGLVRDSYSMVQPTHRFLMLVSALIPSNYARTTIIESGIENFEKRGAKELFAEAFTYLLFAPDDERNIFWEWTYDFIIQNEQLRNYFKE